MSVILRSIQIPLFIKIERGSLSQIAKILDEHHLHFRRPMILSESHILDLGGNDVVHALGNPATILIKTNSKSDGDRIVKEVRAKRNDVIVSIGGGRVLDMGKYVATKAQLNYISAPTAPSNDGICSPVAVLKNDEGVTESISVNMPVGILVDTGMLRSAPVDTIRSGIGDLISNFSAIHDWRIAYADGKERMDDFAASIAYSAAQLMFETCRGVQVDLQNEAFLEKLIHGLILSGIAMNIAGSSRPCSGSEHKLSHAIDALFPGTSTHGIQVGYGTLLMGFVRHEPIEPFIDFFNNVGLPLTHEAMGLSTEQLVEALHRAPEMRAERYTILEKAQLTDHQIEQLITDYNATIRTLTQK